MRKALAGMFLVAFLLPAGPANATTRIYRPRIFLTVATSATVMGEIYHAPTRCIASRTVTIDGNQTTTSAANGTFQAFGAFGGPGVSVTASITRFVYRSHGRRICRPAATSRQIQ
jgi:hypothetical protein